jgi:hypothetical protein
MKSKKKALNDYIARFGSFPCGDTVKADGSNAYITPARGRDGNEYWRVRCLPCWRQSAADAMARLRERRAKASKPAKKGASGAKKAASKKAAAPAKRKAAPAKRTRSR